MARISSKGTVVMMSDGSATSKDITTISEAASAVIAVESGGGASFAEDDIVAISGTGVAELDNRLAKVTDVTGDNVTVDIDTTAIETGTLEASATLTKLTMVETCYNSLSRESPAAATVDATTLCDTARNTVAGMPNPGTWSGAGFWDGEDSGLDALREAYNDGDYRYFQVIMNDGSELRFYGNVNTMSETLGVDAAVAFTTGGDLSGAPTYVPTPAAP